MEVLTSRLAPIGRAFCLFLQVLISANVPPFPWVGGGEWAFTLTSALFF